MFYSPLPSPAALHIPDGMLSVVVSLIMWAVTALSLAYAVKRVSADLDERRIPLMGVIAAFIFAAQMINFPVAGGTSGHLLGGTLAAILLGPWAGMVTMASVVIVQGLLFQDGGLLVMGANVFNMGLLTVLIGYGLDRGVAQRSLQVRLGVSAIAAWISTLAAALATAFQLWLSGTARLDIVMPAMLGVHVLIGIGEALITTAALGFVLRSRPELASASSTLNGGRGWVAVGLLLSLAVVILSPLASAAPDGLERVAIDLGFIERSAAAPYELLPDYTVPFLGQTPVSTVVAGILGALLVATVVVGAILLIMRFARRQQTAESPLRRQA